MARVVVALNDRHAHAADLTRLGESCEVVRVAPADRHRVLTELATCEAVLAFSVPLGWLEPEASPALRHVACVYLERPQAEAALRRGLAVSLAHGCFSPAVAEFALASILSALRGLSIDHAAMRTGREHWGLRTDLPIRELTGLSVGIIGMGGIGRRLLELLAPFGCEIRVHSRHLSAEEASQRGARVTELRELIEHSEVVVVCTAANDRTRHILGRSEIEAMRRHAVLVNVGRGRLVDEDALRERVARGEILAALDVFDVEPLPRESDLRRQQNAYLTPHHAAEPQSCIARGVGWLADDIVAHLAGRELQWGFDVSMLDRLDVTPPQRQLQPRRGGLFATLKRALGR